MGLERISMVDTTLEEAIEDTAIVDVLLEENNLQDSIKVYTGVDTMPAELTGVSVKDTETLVLHGRYKAGDGTTPYDDSVSTAGNLVDMMDSDTFDDCEGSLYFENTPPHSTMGDRELPKILYFKEEIELDETMETITDLEETLCDLEGHAM